MVEVVGVHLLEALEVMVGLVHYLQIWVVEVVLLPWAEVVGVGVGVALLPLMERVLLLWVEEVERELLLEVPERVFSP